MVGVVGRCRDGRYTVNALHCDVWVVGARLPVCIVAFFVSFWRIVFWWKCIPTYLSGFCTFCKVTTMIFLPFVDVCTNHRSQN